MSLHQRRPKTRIAIAQLPMQWSCAANTTAILESLATAADRGAQICVFPELALTGFHRQIRTEAEPTRIGDALRQIQSLCRQRVIACVVGAPTFDGEASPFNSHIHVNERGEIAGIVSKIGLTPSEATFFVAGSLRPIVVLQGIACTSVLCREVEDLEAIRRQLPAGAANIIFWPSLVGKPPSDPPDPDEVNYLPLAQRLAKQSAAYVVQCNWPSSLNSPSATHLGESAVVSELGEVLFSLPRDQPGVATFALGEKEYEWMPVAV